MRGKLGSVTVLGMGICLFAGCALAQWKQPTSESSHKVKTQKKMTDESISTGKVRSWTAASGLTVEEVKVGKGPQAIEGKTLFVFYMAKDQNGTRIHSSHQLGHPFSFKLGEGQVIQGWEEGLLGMQAGGQRRITVPPSLGYGARSVSNQDKSIVVPKNTTIIYDVKLIEIK